jgi:hypothetical protein
MCSNFYYRVFELSFDYKLVPIKRKFMTEVGAQTFVSGLDSDKEYIIHKVYSKL